MRLQPAVFVGLLVKPIDVLVEADMRGRSVVVRCAAVCSWVVVFCSMALGVVLQAGFNNVAHAKPGYTPPPHICGFDIRTVSGGTEALEEGIGDIVFIETPRYPEAGEEEFCPANSSHQKPPDSALKPEDRLNPKTRHASYALRGGATSVMSRKTILLSRLFEDEVASFYNALGLHYRIYRADVHTKPLNDENQDEFIASHGVLIGSGPGVPIKNLAKPAIFRIFGRKLYNSGYLVFNHAKGFSGPLHLHIENKGIEDYGDKTKIITPSDIKHTFNVRLASHIADSGSRLVFIGGTTELDADSAPFSGDTYLRRGAKVLLETRLSRAESYEIDIRRRRNGDTIKVGDLSSLGGSGFAGNVYLERGAILAPGSMYSGYKGDGEVKPEDQLKVFGIEQVIIREHLLHNSAIGELTVANLFVKPDAKIYHGYVQNEQENILADHILVDGDLRFQGFSQGDKITLYIPAFIAPAHIFMTVEGEVTIEGDDGSELEFCNGERSGDDCVNVNDLFVVRVPSISLSDYNSNRWKDAAGNKYSYNQVTEYARRHDHEQFHVDIIALRGTGVTEFSLVPPMQAMHQADKMYAVEDPPHRVDLYWLGDVEFPEEFLLPSSGSGVWSSESLTWTTYENWVERSPADKAARLRGNTEANLIFSSTFLTEEERRQKIRRLSETWERNPRWTHFESEKQVVQVRGVLKVFNEMKFLMDGYHLVGGGIQFKNKYSFANTPRDHTPPNSRIFVDEFVVARISSYLVDPGESYTTRLLKTGLGRLFLDGKSLLNMDRLDGTVTTELDIAQGEVVVDGSYEHIDVYVNAKNGIAGAYSERYPVVPNHQLGVAAILSGSGVVHDVNIGLGYLSPGGKEPIGKGEFEDRERDFFGDRTHTDTIGHIRIKGDLRFNEDLPPLNPISPRGFDGDRFDSNGHNHSFYLAQFSPRPDPKGSRTASSPPKRAESDLVTVEGDITGVSISGSSYAKLFLKFDSNQLTHKYNSDPSIAERYIGVSYRIIKAPRKFKKSRPDDKNERRPIFLRVVDSFHGAIPLVRYSSENGDVYVTFAPLHASLPFGVSCTVVPNYRKSDEWHRYCDYILARHHEPDYSDYMAPKSITDRFGDEDRSIYARYEDYYSPVVPEDELIDDDLFWRRLDYSNTATTENGSQWSGWAMWESNGNSWTYDGGYLVADRENSNPRMRDGNTKGALVFVMPDLSYPYSDEKKKTEGRFQIRVQDLVRVWGRLKFLNAGLRNAKSHPIYKYHVFDDAKGGIQFDRRNDEQGEIYIADRTTAYIEVPLIDWGGIAAHKLKKTGRGRLILDSKFIPRVDMPPESNRAELEVALGKVTVDGGDYRNMSFTLSGEPYNYYFGYRTSRKIHAELSGRGIVGSVKVVSGTFAPTGFMSVRGDLTFASKDDDFISKHVDAESRYHVKLLPPGRERVLSSVEVSGKLSITGDAIVVLIPPKNPDLGGEDLGYRYKDARYTLITADERITDKSDDKSGMFRSVLHTFDTIFIPLIKYDITNGNVYLVTRRSDTHPANLVTCEPILFGKKCTYKRAIYVDPAATDKMNAVYTSADTTSSSVNLYWIGDGTTGGGDWSRESLSWANQRIRQDEGPVYSKFSSDSVGILYFGKSFLSQDQMQEKQIALLNPSTRQAAKRTIKVQDVVFSRGMRFLNDGYHLDGGSIWFLSSSPSVGVEVFVAKNLSAQISSDLVSSTNLHAIRFKKTGDGQLILDGKSPYLTNEAEYPLLLDVLDGEVLIGSGADYSNMKVSVTSPTALPVRKPMRLAGSGVLGAADIIHGILSPGGREAIGDEAYQQRAHNRAVLKLSVLDTIGNLTIKEDLRLGTHSKYYVNIDPTRLISGGNPSSLTRRGNSDVVTVDGTIYISDEAEVEVVSTQEEHQYLSPRDEIPGEPYPSSEEINPWYEGVVYRIVKAGAVDGRFAAATSYVHGLLPFLKYDKGDVYLVLKPLVRGAWSPATGMSCSNSGGGDSSASLVCSYDKNAYEGVLSEEEKELFAEPVATSDDDGAGNNDEESDSSESSQTSQASDDGAGNNDEQVENKDARYDRNRARRPLRDSYDGVETVDTPRLKEGGSEDDGIDPLNPGPPGASVPRHEVFAYWSGSGRLDGSDGLMGANGIWKKAGSFVWSDKFKIKKGDYDQNAAELTFRAIDRLSAEEGGDEENAPDSRPVTVSITLEADEDGNTDLPFRKMIFEDNYDLNAADDNPADLVLQESTSLHGPTIRTDPKVPHSSIEVANGKKVKIDAVIRDQDASTSIGLVKEGLGSLVLGGANTFTSYLQIKSGELVISESGDLDNSVKVLLDDNTIFKLEGSSEPGKEKILEIFGIYDRSDPEVLTDVAEGSSLELPENEALRLVLSGDYHSWFRGSIKGGRLSVIELAAVDGFVETEGISQDPSGAIFWRLNGSSTEFKGRIEVGAGRELQTYDGLLGPDSTVELARGSFLHGRGPLGHVVSSGLINPAGTMNMESLTFKTGSKLFLEFSQPIVNYPGSWFKGYDELNVDGELKFETQTVQFYVLNKLQDRSAYPQEYPMITYKSSNVEADSLPSRFELVGYGDYDSSFGTELSLYTKTDGANEVLVLRLQVNEFSHWAGSNFLKGRSGASGTWKRLGSYVWTEENKRETGNYNPRSPILTFGSYNEQGDPAQITLAAADDASAARSGLPLRSSKFIPFRSLKFEDNYELNPDGDKPAVLVLKGALSGATPDLSGIYVTSGKEVTINAVLKSETPDTGLIKTGAGILKLGGVNTFTGPLHIQEGELVILEDGDLDDNVKVLLANRSIFRLGNEEPQNHVAELSRRENILTILGLADSEGGGSRSAILLPDSRKLRLILTGTDDFTFSGSIKGGEQSVIELVAGAEFAEDFEQLGTWLLKGRSASFKGNIEVNAGRELRLEGILGANSTVVLSSGAVFSGHGSLGNLVSNGGRIVPDGVLNLNSLELGSGSKLLFDIDTPSGKKDDLLNVTGSLSLKDNSEAFVLHIEISGLKRSGYYPLIRYRGDWINPSKVQLSFKDSPGATEGIHTTVLVDAFGVRSYGIRESLMRTSVSADEAATVGIFARNRSRSRGVHTRYGRGEYGSEEEARSYLQDMVDRKPKIFPMLSYGSRSTMNLMLNRGYRDVTTKGLNIQDRNIRVWNTGFGSWGSHESGVKEDVFTSSKGMLAGVGKVVGEFDFTFAGGASLSKSYLNERSIAAKHYSAGLTSSWSLLDFNWRFGLLTRLSDVHVERSAESDELQKRWAMSWNVTGEIGHAFLMPSWSLEPFFGVSGVSITDGEYEEVGEDHESGKEPNVYLYKKVTFRTPFTSIGVRGAYTLKSRKSGRNASVVTRIRGMVSWSHGLGDLNLSRSVELKGDGELQQGVNDSSFIVHYSGLPRNVINVELDLLVTRKERARDFTFGVGYRSFFSAQHRNSGGVFTISSSF